MSDAASPPWEQQPNEPDHAYAQFRVFLGLDPVTRSHKACAEQCERELQTIRNLASMHRWTERVLAWDRYISGVKLAELETYARRVAVAQAEAAVRMADLARARLAEIQHSDLDVDQARNLAKDAARILEGARDASALRVSLGGPGDDDPDDGEGDDERDRGHVMGVVRGGRGGEG